MCAFVLFISLLDNSQSDVNMIAAVTGGGVVLVVLIFAGTSIMIVVLMLRYHRRNYSTKKYESFNISSPMHYTLQNVPTPIYITAW